MGNVLRKCFQIQVKFCKENQYRHTSDNITDSLSKKKKKKKMLLVWFLTISSVESTNYVHVRLLYHMLMSNAVVGGLTVYHTHKARLVHMHGPLILAPMRFSGLPSVIKELISPMSRADNIATKN